MNSLGVENSVLIVFLWACMILGAIPSSQLLWSICFGTGIAAAGLPHLDVFINPF